jgi:hypothetical protein
VMLNSMAITKPLPKTTYGSIESHLAKVKHMKLSIVMRLNYFLCEGNPPHFHLGPLL